MYDLWWVLTKEKGLVKVLLYVHRACSEIWQRGLMSGIIFYAAWINLKEMLQKDLYWVVSWCNSFSFISYPQPQTTEINIASLSLWGKVLNNWISNLCDAEILLVCWLDNSYKNNPAMTIKFWNLSFWLHSKA